MIYFNINRMTETLVPACKAVLLQPRALFEQLPRTSLYMNGFGLLSLIVLASSLVSVPFIGFAMIFMLPFFWGFMLFSYWIWAGYLSWAVSTFGGQKLSTAHAFQLASYAAVPMVAGFVPFVGLVATVWSLYLSWLALVVNVKVKPAAATVIIAIPVLLVLVLLVLLADALVALLPQLGSYLHG